MVPKPLMRTRSPFFRCLVTRSTISAANGVSLLPGHLIFFRDLLKGHF
jgi:hypothetical protein